MLRQLLFGLSTRLLYRISRRETTLVQPLMRWFVKRYHVNMDEAQHSDLRDYASFNAFFTRTLHPNARKLTPDSSGLLSPVDGTVASMGAVQDHQRIAAKGKTYTVDALLGCDGSVFDQGSMANIYLSPRDYHRIHLPCDATLCMMQYLPGSLFSVSPQAVERWPDLFARNERLVCWFDTAHFGRMAMVMVGAVNVAAISTTWHGEVRGPARRWDYGDMKLSQGQEIATFNLGSTVILFPEKELTLAAKSSFQLYESLLA